MRDLKKYVSQKVIRDCGIKDRQIWMARYDAVAILTNELMRQKIEYLHYNPVRASIADKSEDWIWSSARDYGTNEVGEIAVDKDWSL